LRLIVGYGFMAHGLAKLSRGPDAFASILQQLAVPMPHLAAWLTVGTELLGGAAILAGLLVRWVSLPMAFVMFVAMVTVHLPYGFSSVRLLRVSASGAVFGPVGYEVSLLYLAAIAALMILGPGPFALDNLLQPRSASARQSSAQ
jgi:putative oxidoreductase